MKTVLVIAALLTIYAHEGISHGHCKKGHWRKFKEDIKHCLEEYDLPRDTLKKHIEIPDDKKCFYHCLEEKKGIMDAEGQITFDKFEEHHHGMSEELLDLNRKCIEAATSEEKCDKAKEIAKCIHEAFEKEWEKHMLIKKECMYEFDIDEETIKKHLIPEEKKCFFKCVAVNSGKMNEDGEWTIEEFKAQHPLVPKWMIKHIESCADANDMDDPCDSAKGLMKCLRNMRKQWKHRSD